MPGRFPCRGHREGGLRPRKGQALALRAIYQEPREDAPPSREDTGLLKQRPSPNPWPATGCLLPPHPTPLTPPWPHHLPAAPECMCKAPGCLPASTAPALYRGRSAAPLEELVFLGCLEGEGEAPPPSQGFSKLHPTSSSLWQGPCPPPQLTGHRHGAGAGNAAQDVGS